jgi:hypothetical protein
MSLDKDKHTSTDPALSAWHDRLASLEREPDTALWERITADLPAVQPRRSRWRLWPVATAAAALVGLVVGLSLRPEPPAANPSTVAESPALPQTMEAAAPAPVAGVAAQFALAAPTTAFELPPPPVAVQKAVAAATPTAPRVNTSGPLQPVQTTDIGPIHPYEQGLQLFATANYCQSHVHLNEARKHVCAREPLDQINQLMSYIESRVSSECLCLAYEEACR